jgi:hypothetical protein
MCVGSHFDSTVAHVASVQADGSFQYPRQHFFSLHRGRANISSPCLVVVTASEIGGASLPRVVEMSLGARIIAKHLIMVVEAATRSGRCLRPLSLGGYLRYCGLVLSSVSVTGTSMAQFSPAIGHYSHPATFGRRGRCQASWSAGSKGASRLWPFMLRSMPEGNPTAITAKGLGLIN